MDSLPQLHRRLHVAMIAPPWYELPPAGYGGLELISAALIDALVRRGHEVTLFGAGTRTGTRARFRSTTPLPQYPRLGELAPAVLHTARVNQMLHEGDFDVVHDHTHEGPMTAPSRPAPTVVTVHGPVDGEYGDYLEALGPVARLVAISAAQRARRPGLAWAGTVHNSLPPEQIGPPVRTAGSGGPAIWLARFSPDKGPDLAIQAARAAGLPLLLVGKCNEPNERRYLDEVIRPLLGPDIELVLNAERPVVNDLFARSRCLLLPIRWPEPFGMVFIEAMAKGLPVVSLRAGAVAELVEDGVTGFICDTPDDLPAALGKVDQLDPAACVAQVRTRFSADLMAQRYEEVYRQAIAGWHPYRTPRTAPATVPVPTSRSGGARAATEPTRLAGRPAGEHTTRHVRGSATSRPARP